MPKTKEELWKLSPSGLYGFTECRACFWLGHHTEGVLGMPWLLNMAMDSILKERYDLYRKKGEFPPEAKKLISEKVKPFTDLDQLNKWRTSANHLQIVNEKAGYVLRGRIDDVFLEHDGRFIPADYKSSGYAPKEDKQKYYRYQLAAYGFMFERAGYKTSDRAYLLHYFVTDTHDPSIVIPFSGHVDRVDISDIKIDRMLKEIVAFLNKPYPGLNEECGTCMYYKSIRKYLK